MKKMVVTCPVCGKPGSEHHPSRPFCSERCKLIDLGAWAGESYRIPAQQSEIPAREED